MFGKVAFAVLAAAGLAVGGFYAYTNLTEVQDSGPTCPSSCSVAPSSSECDAQEASCCGTVSRSTATQEKPCCEAEASTVIETGPMPRLVSAE
jgi:hypothetical protein